MDIQQQKPKLLRLSNILLRLPSVFLLEMLYHSRAQKMLEQSEIMIDKDLVQSWGLRPRDLTLGAQYVGYLMAFLLHALPLRMLLKLYVHFIVGMLLIASHIISSYYLDLDLRTGNDSVFEDPTTTRNWYTFLAIQTSISILCACLMGTKHVWIFSPYLLPLVARCSGADVHLAHSFHITAEIISLIMATVYIISNILVPYHLVLVGYHTLCEYIELYGIVSVIFALYNHLFIPVVYLIFWVSLFFYELYTYMVMRDFRILQEKWLLLLLASIADCCKSPWSLIGLCFSVSYSAYMLLILCKIYLKGFGGVERDNFFHKGWTEGFTLMLLAMQTGLLDLKRIEKILLLSIMLFIVFSSTIQSMHEITDPILLSLGASNTKSIWKHVKVLAMCLALFLIPIYLSYSILVVFEVEIWLLIIVSSCLLTSIQTFSSLLIYLLFMVDHRRKEPWEAMDEYVYGIHAMCHVLEFTIAVCVLGYGGTESFASDTNLLGASVMVLHCYFNVWQRATTGWKSFLKRRAAAGKIKSLPVATEEELAAFNDICAICYESMMTSWSLRKHYFHGYCLRRWLYVQDKCPLCHTVIVPVTEEDEETEGGDAPNADAVGGGDATARAADDSSNQDAVNGGATSESVGDNSEVENCKDAKDTVVRDDEDGETGYGTANSETLAGGDACPNCNAVNNELDTDDDDDGSEFSDLSDAVIYKDANEVVT
ncbi:LOW QUALITY PROTEIN: RING finger protein 145-like [Amphiura filiformis]|uniref:LOW QUALITY PROTEIN: RING finger protein 145-like n=1 Tax=Amphiura filiformis TaxID=82378 RepID=UPI003B21181B